MCGRFYNHVQAMHDWTSLLEDWPGDGLQSYNVAPTQSVPIITEAGVVSARWGLVPAWSKEFNSKYATHNARIETVSEKASFREAWRRGRRCLVPAGGYYEWRNEHGHKQPYVITQRDEPLVFAGLWEPWGEALSFTILTMPASASLHALHPRMPCMLEAEQARHWLAADCTDAMALAENTEVSQRCQFFKVSRAVNNARSDGATLIEPDEAD